ALLKLPLADSRPLEPTSARQKSQTVIQTAVSCPSFSKPHMRPGAAFSLTLARNDEMHEIPNLPFPSLNPEEQSVAAHAEPTPAVDQDGDDQSSADQE
ncbi:hypothetical protein, partial [Pseudomonas mosselii]